MENVSSISYLSCFVILGCTLQSAGAYDFSSLRESGKFVDEAPGGSPAPKPAPAVQVDADLYTINSLDFGALPLPTRRSES